MPPMRLVCAKEGVRGRKGSRPRTPLMLSPGGVKADAVGDKKWLEAKCLKSDVLRWGMCGGAVCRPAATGRRTF